VPEVFKNGKGGPDILGLFLKRGRSTV